MFRGVSAKLTDKLISLKTIDSDDREIYEFGIQHIFITILNLITVLIIGFLLRSTKEALVFIVAFIPLRIFAGGFHFSTPTRCYIFSSCFVAAVLLAMRYYSISLLIYCLLYCMASIIILVFSPVEDKNKPLDQLEKRVYRKRTIIVFAVENLIMMILYFAKIHFAVKSMMISTIALSLMILMGIIKNNLANSN
jgi:accessory gene regulator B